MENFSFLSMLTQGKEVNSDQESSSSVVSPRWINRENFSLQSSISILWMDQEFSSVTARSGSSVSTHPLQKWSGWIKSASSQDCSILTQSCFAGGQVEENFTSSPWNRVRARVFWHQPGQAICRQWCFSKKNTVNQADLGHKVESTVNQAEVRQS